MSTGSADLLLPINNTERPKKEHSSLSNGFGELVPEARKEYTCPSLSTQNHADFVPGGAAFRSPLETKKA